MLPSAPAAPARTVTLHRDEADGGAGRLQGVGDALFVRLVADEQHDHVLERTGLGVLERRHDQIGGRGRNRATEGQQIARQHATRDGVLHALQLPLVLRLLLVGGGRRHHVGVRLVRAHALHVLLHDLAKIGIPGLRVVHVGRFGCLLYLLRGLLLATLLVAGTQGQGGGQRDGSNENELTHGNHLRFRVVCWSRTGPSASAAAWPVAPPDARNRRYPRRGGRSRAPATRR